MHVRNAVNRPFLLPMHFGIKAYSGLTDVEINHITEELRTSMIKDEGYRIVVRPEIVLEIAFDSIQKSDRHNSGFALSFPRVKNIRKDKKQFGI